MTRVDTSKRPKNMGTANASKDGRVNKNTAPLLIVSGVHKRFGGIHALDGCSITVQQGRITALIGPNGSGKTTLFDVISQITDEDEGDITFSGKSISHYTPFTAYKVAKHGISRTFQDVRLFRHLTIKEHLLLAQREHDIKLVRNILGIGKEDETMMLARAQETLALLKLDKPLDTTASDLSYGQRKLLDLAIAILKPHRLLMLDEPVAGVNPKVREIIKDALRTLVRRGETILLIEHDMNFTMELADDVYVLDAGKVIAHGKPAIIRKDRRVLEAYLGE
jgi:ABC-type branched-subunit amino acid transport system ATPase component